MQSAGTRDMLADSDKTILVQTEQAADLDKAGPESIRAENGASRLFSPYYLTS